MKIISRTVAHAQGKTKYFPKSACLRGHITERWTASGMCCACARNAANTPAVKRRRRAYGEKYRKRPGAKQRLQKYMRAYLKRPNVIARRRAYRRDPEKRKKELFVVRRSRARRCGVRFTLNFTDIKWPVRCPVLGLKLNYCYKGTGRARFNSASLDRRDSAKGYVRGNVFVISWRANWIKNNATGKELTAVAKYARGRSV